MIKKFFVFCATVLLLGVALPALPQPQRATLLFAGDLMAHSPQLSVAKRKSGYDFKPSFAPVAPIIRAADLAVANFETTLGGEKRGYTGYPCFSTPDEYADALKDAGFDVLTTANNHCMDRHYSGLERTVKQLQAKGFATIGTYAASEDRESVLIHDVNGIKIALLSWTYGTNGIRVPEDKRWSVARLEEASADLAAARSLSPDLIVALPHIGTEYTLTPPKYVTSFVEKLLAAGADAVIASHPHVVQAVELRRPASQDVSPRLVAWSMGNFISNQRPAPRDMGVIVRMTVEKSGDVARIVSADAIPTWVQVRTSKGVRVSRVLPLTAALKKPTAFSVAAADLKRLGEAFKDFCVRVLGNPAPLKELKTAYELVPLSQDRFSTARHEEREKRRREALSADKKPQNPKRPAKKPRTIRKRVLKNISTDRNKKEELL